MTHQAEIPSYLRYDWTAGSVWSGRSRGMADGAGASSSGLTAPVRLAPIGQWAGAPVAGPAEGCGWRGRYWWSRWSQPGRSRQSPEESAPSSSLPSTHTKESFGSPENQSKLYSPINSCYVLRIILSFFTKFQIIILPVLGPVNESIKIEWIPIND